MKTFVLAAAVLALATPLHAQSAAPATAGQNADQGAVSAATKAFVTNAAMTDMSEIAAAHLAIKKTDDPAYLDYAQLMIADHTSTNEQLKKIAADLRGVQLPQEFDSAHKRKIDRLGSLSGPAFDREYKNDQVQGHQQAIAMFQDYAKSGDNPDLKTWAGQSLPTFKAHLERAQALPDPPAAPTTGSGPQNRSPDAR